MKLKSFLTAAFLAIISACQSQPAVPTVTATIVLTETSVPTLRPGDVFGAIPLNSVQAFSIEPVAMAVFENTLQGYATADSIQEFRVDSIAVFPSGEGRLIAEIFYSLRTGTDPWLEDGGAPGPDGWITGKCSRFDLIATETEHQLTNKRLCS